MGNRIFWSLLVFTVFIFGWEIACNTADYLVLILPPPSGIFWQIGNSADRFVHHTLVTLKTMSGGFLFALCIAFPLAWMMTQWGTARLILQPIFVVTQCIPMFALAPMMVLWFGWTYTAVVVPTALMIFLPLTMSIYQGLRSTPKHLLDYFAIHQASGWQILYKLQLPWALPHIFAGFRVSAAVAGIGAIAGEWAGAQEGLGLLMLESRRGADLEMMFGALFCLILISLSLYTLILGVERLIFAKKFVHLARKSITALACGLMIFIANGCQNPLDTQPKKEETRIVLDWLPNPNHVAIYAGIQKDFFAKRGVNLKIQKIRDPSDSLALLTGEQTELAIYYMPSTIFAIAHGAKLKAIGVIIPKPLNSLIYRLDAGILKPSDLSGKTFGYCVDSSGTKYLEYLLNKNQITPGQRRNVSFDLVSTLGAKQVDVIYGAYWNIECEQLRSMGVDTAHFELSEFGLPTYSELIVIAREDSLQTSPEFVKAFQEALQESIDYAKANPEEAFQIYLSSNPDKGEKTRQWERKSWERTYPLLADTQEINEAEWTTYTEWLTTNNLLTPKKKKKG